MTEKRFTLAYEKGNWWAVRDGEITLWKEEVIGLLNEQHETIKTLGIAIAKILQAIKDDRENHAMIMCIEVLKKLEENGVDLE